VIDSIAHHHTSAASLDRTDRAVSTTSSWWMRIGGALKGGWGR